MQRVLVVDDDEATRRQLKRILAKEGLDVVLARDGEQAMGIFEREHPEIIVTDLRMPKVDGMELLHCVKKARPATQVIVVTAHNDHDLIINAIRGGALDYLRKPVDLEQLLVALERAQEKLGEQCDQRSVPTILIVDDDETARLRLARVLKKEGYEVIHASDGEEGLERFAEEKVDVALVDLRMPKKGGLEVIRQMRQSTDDIEAIVITGYGDADTAIQALREGAVNYLTKPLDLEQVLIAVEGALARLNLRRSALFRNRDLELARGITARITSRNKVLVNIGNNAKQSAIGFAERLIESIPLNLLVVDEELRVLYGNRASRANGAAEVASVSAELFARFGMPSLSLSAFNELIAAALASTSPAMECLRAGDFAFVMATKLFVLVDGSTKKTALVVFRGERQRSG